MRTTVVILLVAVAAAAAQSSIPEDMLRMDNLRMRQAAMSVKGIADPHIVGGQEAEPHQFPWQAAIYMTLPQGRSFCGGSLIDPEWILTAAHCVEDASKFEIYLGAHSIKQQESTQQRFISTESYAHGGGMSVLTNDIALIKLPYPATLNENVQLVRLPRESQKKETFNGVEATMSGWGRPSDSVMTVASTLRFVKSEIVSDLYCSLRYLSPSMWFRGNNICVSGSGGKGTCNGDSGGPLVIFEEDGKPTQVGLTSFGIAAGCESGWPPAFTRVTKYLDWIKKYTGVSRA